MATEPEIVLTMIAGLSEPTIVIAPIRSIPDVDFVKLFNTVEAFVEQIEKKLNVDFEIIIDDAATLGGYQEIAEYSAMQTAEAEAEVDAEADKKQEEDPDEAEVPF